jgi:Ser/Thr protein kinase RdoA (MazF antagonist)
MTNHDELPLAVRRAWGLGDVPAERLTSGHINRTYRARRVEDVAERSPGRSTELIVQRLSPIFAPEVNEDLDAITAHLAARGVCTPRLLRTDNDALWLADEQLEGVVWRALTFEAGQTILAADSVARCAEAGRLLGRFHRALADCRWPLRHQRLGVHDTRHHLARLRAALGQQREHRHYDLIAPMGQRILAAAERVALPDGLPERLVHGDPKISNILFDESGEARCLVDLDTLARMPLAVELGDALRSWCAPRGEELPDPIDVERFRAAVSGYAESAPPASWLDHAEWSAIAPTTEVIAVELAARFCTDALEERYFGWDASRFASASDHNQQRASAQLALADSIRQRLSELEAITEQLWVSPH